MYVGVFIHLIYVLARSNVQVLRRWYHVCRYFWKLIARAVIQPSIQKKSKVARPESKLKISA